MAVKHYPRHLSESDLSGLLPHVQKGMGQANAQIQLKLRGNILHVLIQTASPLFRDETLLRMIRTLLEPECQTLLATEYPAIYQLYLYSRLQGQTIPDWGAPLYLDRLEHHLEQLNPLVTADTVDAPDSVRQGSALVLSNYSLARRGDPAAIARYLSDTLSSLNVGVWVSVRAVPGEVSRAKGAVSVENSSALRLHPVTPHPDQHAVPRLWIFCEAPYSPDPLGVAKPVAEQLRQLKLKQFRDAVLLFQVQGELSPDWVLRVDLTPPEEMLKEWARWGDEAALNRLINQAVEAHGVAVDVHIKEATLHLCCTPKTAAVASLPETPEADTSVDQETLQTPLANLLEQIAPQGLHRAMIYGQKTDATAPDWVVCLELPASEHVALSEPTPALATQGDLPALAFILTRLLNPDLEEHLITGGIRVQLLVREKLLHVMVDGPICPDQHTVAPQLVQEIKKLRIPDLQGVRIYGRRAGQQRPIWSYGSDFQRRQRLVPEAAPEFAVSDAYLGDLIAPPEEPPLRPEFTARQLQTSLAHLGQDFSSTIQRLLIQTQLFVPQGTYAGTPTPTLKQMSLGSKRIALVWGAAGLLIALQADWLLGHILQTSSQTAVAETEPAPGEVVAPEDSTDGWSLLSQLEGIEFQKSGSESEASSLDQDGFTQSDAEDGFTQSDAEDGFTQSGAGDGFTQSGPEDSFTDTSDPLELLASDTTPIVGTNTIDQLLAASPYPSFKSQQLDEKLALYHQHLKLSGPPDILVIGSSRALRGVDPAALKEALAQLGYRNPTIFNFGVNGSTAQVVDLTIRQIFTADQLPRLILWADGARAFNSGRLDVTYNAIKVSEGYRQLVEGTLGSLNTNAANSPGLLGEAAASAEGTASSLASSYQNIDSHISSGLAQLSAVYEDRNRLKSGIMAGLAHFIPFTAREAESGDGSGTDVDVLAQDNKLIDFDGFLALSVRFNPATYYQNHARVSGAYDGDYEDFRLEGKQSRALQNLLDFTQEKGIPVVFANTPLTDIYLDAYRTEAENEFQQFMLHLSATEEGFIYRDLGQAWTQQYDYFSDPSHLNRYGAYQVSKRLAQDPMIPWPVPENDGTDAPL